MERTFSKLFKIRLNIKYFFEIFKNKILKIKNVSKIILYNKNNEYLKI